MIGMARAIRQTASRLTRGQPRRPTGDAEGKSRKSCTASDWGFRQSDATLGLPRLRGIRCAHGIHSADDRAPLTKSATETGGLEKWQ